MTAADPRVACIQALKRWEEHNIFADDVLHAFVGSRHFSALDRAFFTEAFYGILRNLSLLDFIIERLRQGALDPETRRVLRLGFYQVFLMRVPAHAAVNETVKLAGKARGLVNALLRRALREHADVIGAIEKAPAAVRLSHPEFLVKRWQAQFGEAAAMDLCRWNNTPAENYIRANTLKATASDLLASDMGALPFPGHPLAMSVKSLPLAWIVNGLCYVQDPSTLVSCDLLEPQPGERVLDACAAPGGKASYIAQLMANSGTLVAADSSLARIKRLEENLSRLGVTIAEVVHRDWSMPAAGFENGSFDRILVDAPCSNTGVIRRRVDARWRLSPEDFPRMQERQIAILKTVAPMLRKGGRLVYSTCSIEPEENQELVRRVESEIVGLQFERSQQTLPFRDAVDGAFAARFLRI